MRKLTALKRGLLACWALLLCAYGWDVARRHWRPSLTLQTRHYTIDSSATREQTEAVGRVAESLYAAYETFLQSLGIPLKRNEKLKMKLFANREEFRLCNHISGWAEAFYQTPYCYQYYSADERNPYHWMIHEATHQLNEEAATLPLSKWLDEGLADYFGSSLVSSNGLALGTIDINTYPVWWIKMIARSGNLDKDKTKYSIIPLRAIISGSGGPDMDRFFNLYYLHWWSLTHFLIHGQNGKYRQGFARLLTGDSDINSFEKHIGPIETVEKEWYEYVLALKRSLSARNTPSAPPPGG